MLSVITQSFVMLSVITLNVVELSAIILSVVKLCNIMLSVIKVNAVFGVIMLNFIARVSLRCLSLSQMSLFRMS